VNNTSFILNHFFEYLNISQVCVSTGGSPSS